jgi:hypothetical protein
MIILDDAARWPRLFQWFGAIPRPEIEEWLRHSRLSVPSELIDLWQATGGGAFPAIKQPLQFDFDRR